MLSRLKHIFETIRVAFWPLPAAIALACYVTAEISLNLDERILLPGLSWTAETSAEGLRSLLSTAASGAITLAALVFSTTLVALTLASSQFGPRLLHNFIRARSNQITLGVLVGTFLFCLIVLRSVHEDSLPRISSALAFALTLASLALFLFFVHHLVRSLQAENVVETVADRLFSRIDFVFPKADENGNEHGRNGKELPSWAEMENGKEVRADTSGYLQYIDIPSIVELANEYQCRIQSSVRPGQLVLEHECLFLYDSGPQLEDDSLSALRHCFIIGKQRTAEQDFEFEIRQLVEVGVRALSPGVNDPFTAENCIDLLAIAMSRITRRTLPQSLYCDEEDNPRLLLRPVDFRVLLESAFQRLRYDGCERPDVLLRLLEALLRVGNQAVTPEQREAVKGFVEGFPRDTQTLFHSAEERERFEDLLSEIERLDESPSAIGIRPEE